MRKRSGRYWNSKDYQEFVLELKRRFQLHNDANRQPHLSSLSNRPIFVESDGSVYPDMFQDIQLGSVTQENLSGIYDKSSLLLDIRTAKLKGLRYIQVQTRLWWKQGESLYHFR